MAKATKKAASKKTAAKKSGPKSAPQQAASKKAASKKAASKKVVAKKAAGKQAAGKTAAKKAPQKTASKKVASKKAGAKQAASKQAPKKAVRMSDETMLQQLFTDSLQDMYYAERSAIKAMPKLSKAATSPELKQVLDQHLEMTQGQVQRLEQVFESMGQRAKGKKCEAIEGLIREANEMVQNTRKGSSTRDVAIIMASQKMEHYEISSYGSMATLAAQMGLSSVKELLGQTLAEEKEADQLLTQIAESFINENAEEEGSEGQGGTTEDNDDEEIEGDVSEDASGSGKD